MISLRASKGLRLASLMLVLLFAAAFILVPKSASAQATIPINVNIPGGGQLTGTLTLTGAQVSPAGVLQVVGTITGTLTTAAGQVINLLNQPFVANVLNLNANCNIQILKLDIGQISLNLLGIQVNVAPIHVLITAQGNTVLGGLICAVANLIQGAPSLLSLSQLASLLNQILALVP